MSKFIFTTTGLISPVKFEELGAYFDHPISAYTLSDYFTIEEIQLSESVQDSLDNNYITAVDENGNQITNLTYIGGAPVIDIDTLSTNETLMGYGAINACKISKVVTSINGNYTVLWADGNQNFDKIWSQRNTYIYF